MKFSQLPLSLLGFCIMMLLFQSCYSVRLVSTKGTPMPDQHEDEELAEAKLGDFYKDKMFTVVKKVVPASVFTESIQFPIEQTNCESGKLFSVEYKNSFGGSLLYLATFGGKRKVKITYVCMKPERQ